MTKTLLIGATLAAALAAEATIEPTIGGRVHIDTLKTTLGLTAATPEWHTSGPCGGLTAEKDGSVRCTIEVEGRPKIPCTFRGAKQGEGARLVWTTRPDGDARLAMLAVTGTVAYRTLPGGWFEVDGKRIPLPKGDGQHIFSGKVRTLAVCATNGLRTVFAFAAPMPLYLQNNRPWSHEDFSIRLLAPLPNGVAQGGVTTTFDMTITGAGAYNAKTIEPCTLKAGPDWVPFAATPWIAPGTALDFSAIRRTEKPAGKYGPVVARGGHFEFEKRPGERVRFYGINVCGNANTIPLEEARKFTANLARLGYNAIRFHHHESTMVGGMKDPACCTLNPKAMEGFDALVAACVENGIYMTTDLFVSRHNAGLTWRAIGIDRDGRLDMEDAKRLIPVNAKMYENLLAFTRAFFGHVNRYTGRTFAEEPALMGVSFVNEGNLDKYGAGGYAQYPDWCNAFSAWVRRKRAEDPATFAKATDQIPSDYRYNNGPFFLLFLKETEEQFARKIQAFLRDELKCKALTTNMNDGGGNTVAMQEARAKFYGYVDTHFYVDHPHFLGKSWRLPSSCPNANPILGDNMGAQSVAAVRVFDKPFTITEYNFSGPGRFRGVGGIACGAQAALQDWAGLWRFAWSHGNMGVIHPEQKTMGYFDISGDPLSLAAERASICLFLRGDLAPLKRRYATVIPAKAASTPSEASRSTRTSWAWASWYARLGTRIGETLGAGDAGFAKNVLTKNADAVRAELLPGATAEKMPPAGEGHLRLDGERGCFILDTPRTSGGFAEGGRIDCGAVRADLGKTAATLWASSLTDAPIAETRRILVTYLTDVQNTDISYADANLTVLLGWGRLPHLMRNGEAEVSIAVAPGKWKVWALASDGSRRQELATDYAHGRLAFRVDVDRDPRAASFLYEAARAD